VTKTVHPRNKKAKGKKKTKRYATKEPEKETRNPFKLQISNNPNGNKKK